MARVYLHHEDWQLAADYATKVIKNGRFRLLSGDRFVSMWDGSVDVAPNRAAKSYLKFTYLRAMAAAVTSETT